MHRKYVQRFYNKQWDEASNFDLVLDTGSLSGEEAVKQIVEAARALERKGAWQDAATTASIQVDPVLADAVAKVIASGAYPGPFPDRVQRVFTGTGPNGRLAPIIFCPKSLTRIISMRTRASSMRISPTGLSVFRRTCAWGQGHSASTRDSI